ncbi:hypothetical protein N7481_013296 [Penicillium waksmanii]|uniref:uncharacterized protein n=1 Tax=Penicillium waksmanii TaxID=69791 RepID=UPI0025499885|nr:uncharacterized protein N7481_013296 [Penicillium waksmanii]KAJ5966582.1 hypothetical protein N7481_013296 [Penicillium waksmanii]
MPSTTSSLRIAIVGAGPAGLTLCLLLHARGIKSIIFELRQKPTEEELSKPSGCLDLHQESGLAAIRECGLWEEFIQLTGDCSEAQKVTDKDGIILHEDQGELSDRPEISRHALIKLLASHLPEDSIRWCHKLMYATEIQTTAGTKVQLDFGVHGRHFADFVIGADGAWSQVRSMLTTLKPYYVGTQNITLTIQQLTTKYPHLDDLVGRGSFSALGLHHGVMSQRGPLDSARIYVFLTTPDEQAAVTLGLANQPASAAREMLLTNNALLGQWGETMKDLVAVACDEETMDNPDAPIDIRPLYTLPIGASWDHNPSATLIGDAAHLMCPWAGEGVNLAMLDSLTLAHAIADAVQSAEQTGPSFRWRLSPLLKKCEQTQASRAKEKAEETETNGKMLFSENGAQEFATFFQSVYGSVSKTPETHHDEAERGNVDDTIRDNHSPYNAKRNDSFPTVGETRRRPSMAPKDQAEKPKSHQERPKKTRKSSRKGMPQNAPDQTATPSRTAHTQADPNTFTARGLDNRGNPVMSNNPKLMSGECQRAFDVANSGCWPDVDWREINGKPHYRVATNQFAFRAICGQRIGEAAPSGQGCTTCQDGHGPFATCKIAYLPQVSDIKGKILPSKALFGGGCMGCGLSGAGNRCSLRRTTEPQWVREYFMERVPSLQLSVQFARKPYPNPPCICPRAVTRAAAGSAATRCQHSDRRYPLIFWGHHTNCLAGIITNRARSKSTASLLNFYYHKPGAGHVSPTAGCPIHITPQ